MTKKDYIIISKALGKGLAGIKQAPTIDDMKYLIDCLAIALHQDNPKFAYDKFEAAVIANKVIYDTGANQI